MKQVMRSGLGRSSAAAAPAVGTRFTARTIVALAFSLASLVRLLVAALVFTPVHVAVTAWLRVPPALLLGSIPLAMLGITLAYLLSERGALPANTAEARRVLVRAG
jgi:hypothetical protein